MYFSSRKECQESEVVNDSRRSTMPRHGYYFGAGPAPLPSEVVEKAAEEFIEYEDIGVGLGELSHRSSQATEIIESAKRNIALLLEVPDTHEILFVPGGGTGGFAAIVYNMYAYRWLKTNRVGTANYVVTGTWSAKAAAEARRLCVPVHVAFDGKKNGSYGPLPAPDNLNYSELEEISYVYYCDNETVDGVEFQTKLEIPEGVDLVMDVSSNMLSRKIDVSKYAIIFGGAQKNVGIAGTSIYIVRKDILEQPNSADLANAGLPIAPSILDLKILAKNNSAYNTLSIFAVECIKLVTERLIEKGGLNVQSAESSLKAEKIYKVLDENDKYVTKVPESSRSRMNIVFNLKSPEEEARFIKEAAARELSGIKGHRSVGGIRISNYNAVTMAAIEALIEFMNNFK